MNRVDVAHTVEFTVEFAGIPILIHSCSERNSELLRDYLTDKPPLETIDLTDEDIAKEQKLFDRVAEVYKRPKIKYDRQALEYQVIHGKVAEKLLKYHVLTMHGSAICMDGEAYIFIAPSGTGKSTHTRLWREVFGDRCFMINDDKPLIRMDENHLTVYGTPWAGKHSLSRNVAVPLKAIIRLKRGTENRIVAGTPIQAFQAFITQGYYPEENEARKTTLALEKELAERVHFYELECNMNLDAAYTAWNGMNVSITQ